MNTKEVMKKVTEDEALKAKIQAECKTAEDVYKALKEIGLTDSFEEFKAEAKEVIIKAAEMSFADCDAVAAGEPEHDLHDAVTYLSASLLSAA